MQKRSKAVETNPRAASVVRARRARFRRVFGRFLVVLGCVAGVLYTLSPWVKIGIKGTDSIEGRLFVIVKGQLPTRDGLVAFWPPENRFYQNIWFVKHLKGLPGDVVTTEGGEGRSFLINGQFVGTAKAFSLSGQPLEPGPTGVIPVGQYFVWTPHERSFDSRYKDIGWINESNLIGTAYRIF